ncbi:hypothetical protein L227DRAFT_515983 [Lentinus tigrinus ALCF2SS1-6]|uniref:Uncharacterized protein n=1 Tax=Lentinus tigrinus ALCF2SS1-6 TaxID=1328759 RepID=A0A5C2SUM6_9APHY|nr:hypothetical protein L227DRAFT_515983 [Lentinus tigrinus ALCF2SS1-6]
MRIEGTRIVVLYYAGYCIIAVISRFRCYPVTNLTACWSRAAPSSPHSLLKCARKHDVLEDNQDGANPPGGAGSPSISYSTREVW